MHFKFPIQINEVGFSLTNSFCTNEEGGIESRGNPFLAAALP